MAGWAGPTFGGWPEVDVIKAFALYALLN